MLSSTIGEYIDRREVYAALRPPQHLPLERLRNYDPVWVDFVADVGDGYRATKAVADQLAGQLPDIDKEWTERGSVLLFGGDLVYPTPSRKAYKERMQGPYREVLAQDRRVFAIPGNHDWYDGLGQFYSLFCAADMLDGSRVDQTCSYWSVDLHPRWEAWGLDIGLSETLDPSQKAYFKQRRVEFDVSERRGLILCVSKPFWESDDGGEIEEAVEEILPTEAEAVVYLSGDKHYLAAWGDRETHQAEPAALCVTAGGGGAYLSSTLAVPENVPRPRGGGHLSELLVWPPRSTWARQLRWHVVPKVLRTYSLVAFLGAIIALLGYLIRLAIDEAVTFGVIEGCPADQPLEPAGVVDVIDCVGGSGFGRAFGLLFGAALISTAWWVALIPVVALLWALARHGGASRLGGALACLVHAGAQAGVVLVASASAMVITAGVPSLPARGLLYAMLLWLVGGVLSAFVLAVYLLLASVFKVNLNELASAIWNQNWKNFVRLQLSSEGAEVHLFEIRKTKGENQAAALAKITLSFETRELNSAVYLSDGEVSQLAPGQR